MTTRIWAVPAAGLLSCLLIYTASNGLGQPPDGKGKGPDGKGGFGQPGGKGFGPGGFGPPGGQERKVVAQFDKNGDGWLNKEERQAAREFVKKDGGGRPGFGPPGGFGGPKGRGEAGKPGPKVTPGEVPNYPRLPLYESSILRTLFLEFENPDWEAELQDFHGTDVEVPATLTVDGKKYTNVGVSFRGMSSYGGVPMGSKRSFNVSIDMANPKQRLYGHKTLNLLNSHEDPSFLSTVLYSHVARQYMPAPRANVVKVVVNGESWGLYPSVQQFDKVFLEQNYKTSKGTRWKVRGSPGGDGGLTFVGENVADYRRRYEIKSDENEKAWQDLITLCRVLNQTPAEQLEEALKPILDLDNVLWFLALDVALVNNDGYWTRASDYSIYLDGKGKFHLVPHDMNESFGLAMGFGPPGGVRFGPPRPGEILPPPLQDALQLTEDQKKQLAELQKETDARLDKVLNDEQRAELKRMREGNVIVVGPGGPGGPPGFGPGGPGGPGMGPGGGGVTLDPLVGLNDPRKPLRSKLLAVPALRAKYLANVRTIAEKSLDWKSLGPVVGQYRGLLDMEVQLDTRKLESYEAFVKATADTPPAPAGGGRGGMGLRGFADQRRTFLLNHAEVKKLGQ
jgi:spore coat protein CotH